MLNHSSLLLQIVKEVMYYQNFGGSASPDANMRTEQEVGCKSTDMDTS
jgi:hypothetical protein